MSLTTAQLRDLDRRHLWHPFAPMKLWLEGEPLVITAAEGMYLIDSDGNRYLDGVSSLWCNVHGHRVPEINAAIRTQLDKVAHSTMLGLASEPAILLADRLMKIVPSNLRKIFYSDSGATATEVAFKLAAQYWYNIGRPQKNEFIGFAEGYHGDTFGAMSVGRTEAFHRPYFPMLFKVHFAPTPFVYRPPPEMPSQPRRVGTAHQLPAHMATAVGSAHPTGRGDSALSPPVGEVGRAHPTLGAAPSPVPLPPGEVTFPNARAVMQHCLGELESILQEHASRIAAICIEPMVQGAAGMIVHPPGFLREVRRLASQYEVLLIADEVAVGFGRTGKMFACEHEDVQPDLMCVAKGISGGYLPLAATFATQRIFDAFLGDPWEGKTLYHGHTYTGNALACAAALASLDLFEKNDLIRQVAAKAERLATMLDDLRSLDHVGDIRQKGLMVGIELVQDKRTRKGFDSKRRLGAEICTKLRGHGVILRPLGDVIVLMPPLAMELQDLRAIGDAVRGEVGAL